MDINLSPHACKATSYTEQHEADDQSAKNMTGLIELFNMIKLIPSLYIIGGDNAQIEQHSHQLSLQLYGRHRCGAVLIKHNFALTAAHCVHRDLTVTLGTTNLQEPSVKRKVERTIVHSNWNPRTLDNDFVLLKFQDVNYTDSIWPATLPENNEQFQGLANATGWGRISTIFPFIPSILQKTTLKLLSSELCAQIWNIFPQHDSVQCIISSTSNVCNGDSGGLLTQYRNNTHILIGIASFGVKGCNINTPAGFAKVSHVRPWIKEVIRSEETLKEEEN